MATSCPELSEIPWQIPFSSPEPTILLACGRDRELWPDPIFWVCAEYSFRILNQSDLPDLTGSPWIADFRCWTKPELSILATGQKDRGLWGREWTNSNSQFVYSWLFMSTCTISFWLYLCAFCWFQTSENYSCHYSTRFWRKFTNLIKVDPNFSLISIRWVVYSGK